jgi:hypothetical protein
VSTHDCNRADPLSVVLSGVVPSGTRTLQRMMRELGLEDACLSRKRPREQGADSITMTISPQMRVSVLRPQRESWLFSSFVSIISSSAELLPLPTTMKKRIITDYFHCSPRRPNPEMSSAMDTSVVCSTCDKSNRGTTQCTFCMRSSCTICLAECARCANLFCKYCSTVNYEVSQPRSFCLDCHNSSG